MKTNGFTELGNELRKDNLKVSQTVDTKSADLGTINADYSLLMDSFRQPIPKGDYMVDVRLTSSHGFSVVSGGSHTHGDAVTSDGTHTHELKIRTLKPGDRVIVEKVGTERIVTAIITSSNNI